MIEKTTTVDQITLSRWNAVQIRFGLLLIENGNAIERKWHRTMIIPGDSVDAQVAAVNIDLARNKYVEVSIVETNSIKAQATQLNQGASSATA